MTNEAESLALPRPGHHLVLRGADSVATVRPWSFQPTTAHLVMVQQRIPPTADDLQKWCLEVAGAGYQRVRTNAIGDTMRARAEAVGFETVQELTLLEYVTPRGVALSKRATERLGADHHTAASIVDRRAFGAEWALDAATVAEVRRATPRHRARRIVGDDGALAGYAISGRDQRQGFIQRLAVDPDQQRTGIGLALVLDALHWLAFWHVSRVLVNTAVDNTAALALYRRVGFRPLTERLRVFERVLP
jgi:ribosomal protein S18 acetylase RimI-like enzyme